MYTQVLKFSKRLLILLIALFIVDQALGFILEKIYFGQKKGQFAQTTFSINKTNQDLLIFGSSRAVRHYSPKILSDSLRLSVYNVGRDAQQIPYYYAMQQAIFCRYKPKMIILDINAWELAPGDTKFEKLSVLLPYCSTYPTIVKIINEVSEWESLKLLSRTYPYNSSLFILTYNSLFPNKIAQDDNGYAPLSGQLTDAILDDHVRGMQGAAGEEDKSHAVDERALAYFNKFLSDTEKFKIKTFIIVSPKVLREPVTYRMQLLINSAKKYGHVKFIDFSNNPKYTLKKELFADIFHLNTTGSELFSRDLIKLIR